MDSPKYLSVKTGYAHFVPEGEVTLQEGVALVAAAIRYCRENQMTRLLVDVSHLTGYKRPQLDERYWMAQEWAQEARGQLVAAMIAPEEMLDPQRFGVLVARNAGFRTFATSQENAALDWLLAQEIY